MKTNTAYISLLNSCFQKGIILHFQLFLFDILYLGCLYLTIYSIFNSYQIFDIFYKCLWVEQGC